MKSSGQAAVLSAALVAVLSASARADVMFFDDFDRESLNPVPAAPIWVGGPYGATNGFVAVDPLDGDNGVLMFASTRAGGDAFTSATFGLEAHQSYELSFRYMGTASSVTGYSSGGYIGVYDAFSNAHNWLAGSFEGEIQEFGLLLDVDLDSFDRVLADDGQWHDYSVIFRSDSDVMVRIMVEDYLPPTGNGHFDDIQLAAVPLPASASMGATLLCGVGAFAWLRRRRAAARSSTAV